MILALYAPRLRKQRLTRDKRGNRTRYDKNVQGLAADYGIAYDLAYTFDGSSLLTQITDANAPTYRAAVTCDANNNITTIDETTTVIVPPNPPAINHVYTYFDVNALNRVTAHRTKVATGPLTPWLWVKRTHEYDGLGRLVRSGWKQWKDGDPEPSATTLDGTNRGKAWHWAQPSQCPRRAAR